MRSGAGVAVRAGRGPTLITMAQPTGGPSYEAARDELLEVVPPTRSGRPAARTVAHAVGARRRTRGASARPGSTARASASRRAARLTATQHRHQPRPSGRRMTPPETPDRNLALELVRVTEAAAMAAGRWVGLGEKNDADASAVDAMRRLIGTVAMRWRRRHRRGRERPRPDALQRRTGRRRHGRRDRRRGRPDRRHPPGRRWA